MHHLACKSCLTIPFALYSLTTNHVASYISHTECFDFFPTTFFPSANLRPSVGQLQSPELRVFQEKRLFLHVGIINNIRGIARRAFARGLIPDGVSRNITDTQSHDEKTDLLLRELESRIRIDRTVLTQFIDVLRESDAACYATLMSTISTFCTVASDAVGF